jgi:hypothetical protein
VLHGSMLRARSRRWLAAPVLLLGVLGLLSVCSHVAMLQASDLHCEDAGCVAVLMIIAVATSSAWGVRRYPSILPRRLRAAAALLAPALALRCLDSVRLGLPPPPELAPVLRR